MLVKNISFLNGRKEVVKSFKLTSAPIGEQTIIARSIEFFNDPEPCFIHRSAVIKRLIAEMDDYFYNISKTGVYEIRCAAFNEKFNGMLNFGKDVESLSFELLADS